MSWFRKPKQKLSAGERRDMPSDVFDKCPRCGDGQLFAGFLSLRSLLFRMCFLVIGPVVGAA